MLASVHTTEKWGCWGDRRVQAQSANPGAAELLRGMVCTVSPWNWLCPANALTFSPKPLYQGIFLTSCLTKDFFS